MGPLHLVATLVSLVTGPPQVIAHVPGVTLTGGLDELSAWHVAAAGDVNRDGFDDVLVYATTNAPGPLNGVVRVHSGLDGAVLFTFPGIGNHPIDGIPMAGAGDVDGDGHADIAVGSSVESRATLYSGRNGAQLLAFHGDAADDGFGGCVAAAGDVDGDGHPDLVVGATRRFSSTAQGYARVFSGADGTPLFSVHEESGGDAFGAAVSGVGDVDGDGHADIAVGAYSDGIDVLDPGFPPFIPPFWTEDLSGSVTVFSGADGTPLWTVHGGQADDLLGSSVSGVGDVDGDGFDDVLAGSRTTDPMHPVYACVLSGVDGGVLHTFSGDGTGTAFVSVSGAGDLDGDGVPDALVGNLVVSPSRGIVRAFSGANGSILFEYQPQSWFGSSVAGLGDANGDGLTDFVVGVTQNHYGGGFAQLFVSQGAVAQATVFGCGGNPAGSLAIVAGAPALGETVTLALDDPASSLRLPAAAFLLVSSQADAAFPCGTVKPGWGLAAPGSAGELLVSVAPAHLLLVLEVGTYAGSPLEVALTIPSIASLLGESIFVQGALVDGTPRIGLTDAVALSIGVP